MFHICCPVNLQTVAVVGWTAGRPTHSRTLRMSGCRIPLPSISLLTANPSTLPFSEYTFVQYDRYFLDIAFRYTRKQYVYLESNMSYQLSNSFVPKILPTTLFSAKICRKFPANSVISQDRRGGGWSILYVALPKYHRSLSAHQGQRNSVRLTCAQKSSSLFLPQSLA